MGIGMTDSSEATIPVLPDAVVGDGLARFGEVRRGLEDLLSEVTEFADTPIAVRAHQLRQRLANDRLRIVVVGEFSRGKSTLINALIGQPVLPSRVNPTTATITAVTGGSPAEAMAEYRDGSIQRYELPEERVNHFLDSLVSTANQKANRIGVFRIHIPGRLEELQAEIIDTPGVNDLDLAREELTYNFIPQADAAVLLLDAQQPLSESERIFVREKVLQADVKRILFVINKIDEVVLGGTLDDIPRVVDNVRRRLAESLGISDPPVYGVSAKCTLRARFRGEPDTSPWPFINFETDLFRLAAEHATAGRMRLTCECIRDLLADQCAIIEEQVKALEVAVEELDGHLGELEIERSALEERLQQVSERVERERVRLADRVADYCREQVGTMRLALADQLARCTTDAEAEEFRARLAEILRSLVTDVERFAALQGSEITAAVVHDYEALLAHDSSRATLRTGPSLRAQDLDLSVPSREGLIPATADEVSASDVAAGIGLACIGGALFGPLGIVAAVCGAHLWWKDKRARQTDEQAKRQREAMARALHDSCDKLVERAQQVGDVVAAAEAERITDHIRKRMETRAHALMLAVSAAHSARVRTREQQVQLLAQAQERLARTVQLEERCNGMLKSLFA
jgi:small GTP-binding protein